MPIFSRSLLQFSRAWRTAALQCALLLCSVLMPQWAQAQIQLQLGGMGSTPDTVTTPRVQAQLVALAPQGIAPGQPLTLGLRIAHQPGWHTYWKNAGDSGLPTQLDWQLPAGMQAGAVQWPVPQQIRVADMLNYGYEDTVLLPVPVQIQAPWQADADGTTLLRLQASWLVCKVECIPEEGQFALRLPADVAHTMWAAEFAAAQEQAPQELPHARAQWTVLPEGDRVRLQVHGLPTEADGRTLAFYPEAPDTFLHAAVLGRDWTQHWEGHVWTATLPLSAMRSETPAQLAFVLGVTPAHDTSGHAPPVHAWRLIGEVDGRWKAAATATISPALAAALADNAKTPPSAPHAPTIRSTHSGLWAAVLGGLIGGLLLNLMPCVFPVLAIKLMALARQGTDAAAQRRSGWAYAAGVIASFMALGAVLLALRAAGEQLGWGFQLQSPWVVAALAALFTLIGLNLAGVFELTHVVPERLANWHARSPLADAFISGVVAVAIASPCTAPFMGASLGFAVGMPAPQALAVFMALGVGMALPYVLVSWIPALVRWLPRPGAWMDTLRRAMAFPMFATVVWLVWVIGQQTGIDGAAALLALLLCLAALAWALTLRGAPRWVLSVVVLALSAWMVQAVGRSIFAPPPAAHAGATTGWATWSAPAQADALAQGRAVFVDYTAAWCVTCQYNKRTTLSDPGVLADFAQRNVALLRADWTRRDPAITQALAQLGRNGVPVYVLLAPGKAPVVLSELLSRDEVHQALSTL